MQIFKKQSLFRYCFIIFVMVAMINFVAMPYFQQDVAEAASSTNSRSASKSSGKSGSIMGEIVGSIVEWGLEKGFDWLTSSNDDDYTDNRQTRQSNQNNNTNEQGKFRKK